MKIIGKTQYLLNDSKEIHIKDILQIIIFGEPTIGKRLILLKNMMVNYTAMNSNGQTKPQKHLKYGWILMIKHILKL